MKLFQDLNYKILIPEPDFNQTLWASIEEKLERKLLPVENMGIYQTSGMFKEWFFSNLNSWPNEEVERIIDLQADYVYGWSNRPDKPERKGKTPPYKINDVNFTKKSLWQRFIEIISL